MRQKDIFERVKRKAELVRAGDPKHKEIRTLLLVGGGGMKGVFGMGVLHGLSKLGLSDAFDTVVGISAGACDTAYFLSGQTAMALTVYLEDLTDDRFIKFSRLSKVVDIDYLEKVFRVKKKLDVKKIKESRSDFYVGMVDVHGQEKLIDVKQSSDIILNLKASMAMPLLYNRTVEIGEEKMVDGGAADPLPLNKVIERFHPTDVLLVLNEHLHYEKQIASFAEFFLAKIYLRDFSDHFKDIFLNRNEAYRHTLRVIRHNHLPRGVRVGVIAPEDETGGVMLQKVSVLETMAREGAAKALELFGIRTKVE